jgi:hypothetical protein
VVVTAMECSMSGAHPSAMDLDARYSALCDAVRAHPDVPADLRAEITASAHLAGVVYAGGAPTLRGDLATLRRAWDAFARAASSEFYEATRRASAGDVREHRALEGRWDWHVSLVDRKWSAAMWRAA